MSMVTLGPRSTVNGRPCNPSTTRRFFWKTRSAKAASQDRRLLADAEAAADLEIERINSRNRNIDRLINVVAITLFACVAGSLVGLTVWAIWQVVAEIGAWNFGEAINGIAGFRLI